MTRLGPEVIADARAAWAAFDAALTEPQVQAIAGAFALLATVDAEVAEDEVRRFAEVVTLQPEFARLDRVMLGRTFRALAEEMLADPERGRPLALGKVRAVRNDPAGAELVVRAAQIAIVADGRLHEAEERALEEICAALGVSHWGR
ncbi:MAG: TerB family tellurite resistance protein [Myxococcota bacterium]